MNDELHVSDQVAREVLGIIGYQATPHTRRAIAAAIAVALAAAEQRGRVTGLREAADVARRIGYDIHDAAPDPQEDLSDRAGEACAAAILALIPPRAGRSIDCDA
jgi:hypothetical protein